MTTQMESVQVDLVALGRFEKMMKYEILAKNLASSTYSNENELKKILVKLTDSDIAILTSACFRAAEKCSLDVFDCNIVIGDDER